MKQFAFKNLTVNIGKPGGAQLCAQDQTTCKVAYSPLAGTIWLTRFTAHGRPDLVPGCNWVSGPLPPPLTGTYPPPTGTFPPPTNCCGPLHSTWPSHDFGREQLNQGDLIALREQLVNAIDHVDQQAEVIKQELAPQSLEDIAEVEEQLRGALAEVTELKKNFGK